MKLATLTCWLLLALCSTAKAEALIGLVVGVADGDTVTVLDGTNTQYKIRLSGIDAPEKNQPFGQRSKQSLSDLVFNQRVTVDWNKRDRYGRVVGKIITASGANANLEQIKRGMAWHYKQYEREQSPVDRVAYTEAEKTARERRVGLWQDAQPTPPWEFRHKGR